VLTTDARAQLAVRAAIATGRDHKTAAKSTHVPPRGASEYLTVKFLHVAFALARFALITALMPLGRSAGARRCLPAALYRARSAHHPAVDF